MVVSKRKNEGVGGKKEAERVKGEGENIVRTGEGEEETVRGRRGEGEKMLRIGQVEVRVSEKEERRERLHILSPVAEQRGGSLKARRREKVVVLLIFGCQPIN